MGVIGYTDETVEWALVACSKSTRMAGWKSNHDIKIEVPTY